MRQAEIITEYTRASFCLQAWHCSSSTRSLPEILASCKGNSGATVSPAAKHRMLSAPQKHGTARDGRMGAAASFRSSFPKAAATFVWEDWQQYLRPAADASGKGSSHQRASEPLSLPPGRGVWLCPAALQPLGVGARWTNTHVSPLLLLLKAGPA